MVDKRKAAYYFELNKISFETYSANLCIEFRSNIPQICMGIEAER